VKDAELLATKQVDNLAEQAKQIAQKIEMPA
jgi:hypothetical protein